MMTEPKKVFELHITGTKVTQEQHVFLDKHPEHSVSGIEVSVELGMPDHSVNQATLDRLEALTKEAANILIGAVREFEAME